MSSPAKARALVAAESEPSFEYLGILDFEATCSENEEQDGWDSALQEVIELPLTLVHIAKREIVDSFVTVVRPTRQPRLTEFCTTLTSITQREVDAAPDIEHAFFALSTWLQTHNINSNNTLLVTCGDWDLKTMWPRQVGLSAGLLTPRLFQRWCNLKVVFSAYKGQPARGMLEMLQALGLPHTGHHHRGADDVANLTNIVLRLLEAGAAFRYTWGDANREAELNRWLAKSKKANITIDHRERALARLSATAPSPAYERAQHELRTARVLAERAERTVRAFQLTAEASQ